MKPCDSPTSAVPVAFERYLKSGSGVAFANRTFSRLVSLLLVLSPIAFRI